MKEKHPTKRIRVFGMDEARFGQQGTLTTQWAEKGSRPTAVRQTNYEWVYLYAAVDLETGDSSALLARHVNIDTMDVFLRILSEEVDDDDHVVLMLDQAGWHTSARVNVPENITLLFLPPYSPELNPIERLWAYMKSHYLSNRRFADYQALIDAGTDAYRALTPSLLQSICATSWLTPGNQL